MLLHSQPSLTQRVSVPRIRPDFLARPACIRLDPGNGSLYRSAFN
jgi:hypothetical protein